MSRPRTGGSQLILHPITPSAHITPCYTISSYYNPVTPSAHIPQYYTQQTFSIKPSIWSVLHSGHGQEDTRQCQFYTHRVVRITLKTWSVLDTGPHYIQIKDPAHHTGHIEHVSPGHQGSQPGGVTELQSAAPGEPSLDQCVRAIGHKTAAICQSLCVIGRPAVLVPAGRCRPGGSAQLGTAHRVLPATE